MARKDGEKLKRTRKRRKRVGAKKRSLAARRGQNSDKDGS